jgi:hypothetical protein
MSDIVVAFARTGTPSNQAMMKYDPGDEETTSSKGRLRPDRQTRRPPKT